MYKFAVLIILLCCETILYLFVFYHWCNHNFILSTEIIIPSNVLLILLSSHLVGFMSLHVGLVLMFSLLSFIVINIWALALPFIRSSRFYFLVIVLASFLILCFGVFGAFFVCCNLTNLFTNIAPPPKQNKLSITIDPATT